VGARIYQVETNTPALVFHHHCPSFLSLSNSGQQPSQLIEPGYCYYSTIMRNHRLNYTGTITRNHRLLYVEILLGGTSAELRESRVFGIDDIHTTVHKGVPPLARRIWTGVKSRPE